MGCVIDDTIYLFSPADADARTNPVIVLVATIRPLMTYMVWNDYIAFDNIVVTDYLDGLAIAPPGYPNTWTYYPRDWANAQLWPATMLDLGRRSHSI